MKATTMTKTSVPGRVADAGLRRRKLKGPEKAAILFLCLGEKRGSDLMQKLDEVDIQKLTRAMSGLGSVSAPQVEEVMTEFTESITNGSGVVGSFAIAESMLRNLLPTDQADAILKDIRGPLKERDLWARFSALNENVIANYLKGEHEQTAAAILSNVKSDVAAKVLPLLGVERMEGIIERMIKMEAVPHHMMQQLEEALTTDIAAASSQPTASELQQRMADLFNKLDRDAFDRIAPGLEERAADMFNAIKQKMFTFDDLVKLDAMGLARVMRGVPGNTLPMALRGASKEVRDHFLNVLPGRSRDMLLDEMNSMGPVRGRDVREAQTAMVDYAKELADEEVIRLPMDDEEDELIA
ncbi:flagellar motor switch protein FliG [Pseudooceanicola nanhaiensis]|uniref:flagellar motor switch protein FliG n=1 Tax=Pseudooceanicola nanhaiensis TaxID=375761 RepID=UPI001CD7C146|nr:flagellar motor switch protein FliG [Pseudooceanicola nanhaiensis]MCA0922631.1 flagellar motor switch protein FliG [Pseudooceanicola nanhaiensis]